MRGRALCRQTLSLAVVQNLGQLSFPSWDSHPVVISGGPVWHNLAFRHHADGRIDADDENVSPKTTIGSFSRHLLSIGLLFVAAASCGGGGGSGGGCGSAAPVSFTITVQANSAGVATTQTIGTLTITVN